MSKGLSMNATAPRRSASSAYMGNPEQAMIGGCGAGRSLRRRVIKSRPLPPPRPMSVRTSAGRSARASSKAVSTSPQPSTR